ncbi:hypothetical protein GCM10022221_49790 [Actinocorallia aurea]
MPTPAQQIPASPPPPPPPPRGGHVRRALAIGLSALGMSVCLAAGAVVTAPGPASRGSAVPDLAPKLTSSAFQNPPASVRPKYRW